MSFLNKQIISEKTLILWLIFSVLSAIFYILAGALLIFLVYDCWPLRGLQPGFAACFSHLVPSYAILLPLFLGALTGILLTIKYHF
jgi:hypothetical protein